MDPTLDKTNQYPRNGTTIVDTDRQLFTIDLDGLKPNPGFPLDTALAFVWLAPDTALSRLPKAFSAAGCMLIATASTGLPTNSRGEKAEGRAWLRLVFHLSRPLTCAKQELIAEALKKLFGLECIDLSGYSPPQFEFVARLRFLPGARDPIKDPVIPFNDGPPLDVDALLAELGLDLDAPAPTSSGSPRLDASGVQRVLDVAPERRVPLVRQAVAAIRNTLERNDWVRFGHAVDGALDGDPEAEDIFLDFSARRVVGTSDEDENERVWNSRGDGRAGFGYIAQLLEKQGTPEAVAAILAIRQARAKACFRALSSEEIEAAGDVVDALARKVAAGDESIWVRWRAALNRIRRAVKQPPFVTGGWTEDPDDGVFEFDPTYAGPAPIRPQVSDRLTRGLVGMISAAPNVGKSTYLSLEALAIATENGALIGQQKIDWCDGDALIVSNEESREFDHQPLAGADAHERAHG